MCLLNCVILKLLVYCWLRFLLVLLAYVDFGLLCCLLCYCGVGGYGYLGLFDCVSELPVCFDNCSGILSRVVIVCFEFMFWDIIVLLSF